MKIFFRKIVIAILFFMLALEGTTQTSSPPNTLLFQRLTVDKGLSQAGNRFIFKDSKGFVWISSVSGLNRFDGNSVKIYRERLGDTTSIKGANINGNFSEDEVGNIWFSTYNAVCCYVRKEDNFRNYTLTDSLEQPLVGYFTCGLDRNNKLWVKHKNGLYQFDIISKKFNYVTKIEKSYQRSKIELTADGKIKRAFFYSGSQNSGVQIIDFDNYGKTRSKILFDKNTISSFLPNIIIEEVAPENDTLTWLATPSGIIALNPIENTFSQFQIFKIKDKKPSPIWFWGMDHYDDNHLVLASKGDGISFFNKTKKSFSKFYTKVEGEETSLLYDSPNSIYTDQHHGIWANVGGLSVEYTTPPKIKFETHLSPNDSFQLNSYHRIFKLSNGKIWLAGTGAKNFIINDEYKIIESINSSTHSELGDNFLMYHFEDNQQRVWLLGWGGLAYYDLKAEKIYNVETTISGHPVIFIFGQILQDGNIIFTSYQGGIYQLEQLTNSKLGFKLVSPPNMKEPFPIFFQGENGNIYANENLSHLVIFNKEFELKEKIPIAADFKCFYEPTADSILWIGSDRGLIAYNKWTEKFRFFTEDEGLPNAMIYGIVPDDNNNLWLSTNAGLVKFNQENFAIKNYDVFDGLPFLEYNSHSFFRKENGEIMFGRMGGITTFHPGEIVPTPYLTSPQITSIKINDESSSDLKCMQTNATNASEIKALELDYEQNTISLEFSAMDYGNAKKNQYRYQLEGEDEKWIEAGTRNFVRYSNLSPGSYNFLLHAANSDGSWSKSPLRLKLNIVPPFWQQSWFLLLAFLALAGLIWVGFRIFYEYKFGKKLALEKQKLFWARKMHEDLGADYSSLKIRIGMLDANLSEGKDVQKESNRIVNLAERVAKQIRTITWSLSLKNDYLEKLINYLQDYAAKLFEDTSFNLQFPLPENLPEKKISGEYRMTVLHVFKEALNNIQKHSKATTVNITIQTFPSYTTISIIDNGVGFDPALFHTSSGNGLTNMKERIQEIGGRCKIKTSPQGTSVLISFPY